MRKLAGIAVAVAMLGSGSAVAVADPPRSFYGVTPQTELFPADFTIMERGGVGTLRIPMTWTEIDSAPLDPANPFRRTYDWSRFDPTLLEAARSGIRLLPTVYGTPQWVATLQGCASDCHKLGPSSIPAYIGFALFMRAAAERYGPGGKFWKLHPNLDPEPIRVWQIWNEQNSSDYWKPFPNVRDYANLVEVGGEAIHAVDPGAQVILGGMIGEPAQEGKETISGWDFLNDLYELPATRAAFDGISIHPYGASLKSVKGTVGRWRKELRAVRAPKEPIWVSEIGWASGGEEHPLNRGPRGQADLIEQALAYFTRQRDRLNIKAVILYSWRDAAPGAPQCTWCARSGLLRYEGLRPKPAWDTFKEFTLGP